MDFIHRLVSQEQKKKKKKNSFTCNSVEMTVVNTWGYNVNGSWTGMSGYLQRGDADIGATAMFVTADRLPILTYIAGTTSSR